MNDRALIDLIAVLKHRVQEQDEVMASIEREFTTESLRDFSYCAKIITGGNRADLEFIIRRLEAIAGPPKPKKRKKVESETGRAPRLKR